jgi:hypothetical protein
MSQDALIDVFKELETELNEVQSGEVRESPRADYSLVVSDTKSATYVARLKSQIALVRENLEKRYREALSRLDAQDAVIDKRVGNTLETWVKANLPVDIKTGKQARSVDLTYMTAKLRKIAENLAIEDEVAVLNWAKEHAEECYKVKVDEVIDKKALNAHWKKTGEVPPGCEVTPEHDSFSLS